MARLSPIWKLSFPPFQLGEAIPESRPAPRSPGPFVGAPIFRPHSPLLHGFSGSKIPVTIWLSSSGNDTFLVMPPFLRSEFRKHEGPMGEGLTDGRTSQTSRAFVSNENLIWSHISAITRARRIYRTKHNNHNAEYRTTLIRRNF